MWQWTGGCPLRSCGWAASYVGRKEFCFQQTPGCQKFWSEQGVCLTQEGGSCSLRTENRCLFRTMRNWFGFLGRKNHKEQEKALFCGMMRSMQVKNFGALISLECYCFSTPTHMHNVQIHRYRYRYKYRCRYGEKDTDTDTYTQILIWREGRNLRRFVLVIVLQ